MMTITMIMKMIKVQEMKRLLSIISLAVAASAMFSGCTADKSEPQKEMFTRQVQITVTKDVDTKTAVVEGEDKASYVWTEGDEQYFKVYENTTLGTVTGIEYSSDMKKATLTVEFNTTQAEEYVYKAKFTKDVSNAGNPKIQAEQSPSSSSYDPGADVMVSEEITSATALTSLKFVMNRKVTVNKMTLKGLTPGEVVNRVVMNFSKSVTGYYIYSGENAGGYSPSGTTITVSYNGEAVPSDGTFPVYFIAMPAEGIALESVTVTSNINAYTRTEFSKTYDFALGKMARFGINMADYATPISSGDIYTLVSSTSELEAGQYIIAASEYDKAMGHLSGTIHTSEDVTKSGNTITLDNTSSVLPLTLAKSGSYWTIQNADSDDSNYGNYLAWSSGNSSIETSGSYTWEISVSGGVATITSASTSSRSLQYNSGSPRFACYTSSQQPVALYKRSGAVYPVGISFATESYSFTKGSSEYNAFTGQTVTKDASDTRTVTYTISGTIGTVDSSTGTVALNGSAGEATVTATVDADATHSAGSVSYSITVIAAAADYDLLDYAFIGVSGTTYTDKSGLVGSSGRGSKYTTNSAGGNSAIQLRSDKSNSGIVTTSSGGYAYKIVVSWNSNTASGRTLQVYGKNTAYSSPSDLYSSSSQGTLLGTIVYGSSTELVITGDYAYIGLRSSSGAMWLDEIDVYWMDGEPSTSPVINVTSSNPISVSKSGGSQTISYTITNPVSGQSLTASTDVTWISNISVSSSTVTFTVAAQAAGASSRAGTVTLAYSGASSVQVGINQEAGEGGSQAANGWLELPAKTTGSDYYSNTFTVGGARNYTYLYQYSTYTTLWTAYPLYSATMGSSTAALGPYYPQIMSSQEDRGTSWAANPQFDKSLQVNVWSGSYGVNVADPPYVSDIYARGHNIPNSDRSANGSMQTQTYYATNSTPQIQNRFNGYIWNQLEQGVRAAVSDTIYVVTGATFHKVTDGTESITYITPQHDTGKSVPVPYYYWKVLLKVKRSGNTVTSASAIGFWFVHQQYNSNDYTPYAVSVDKIEEYTGFDFFVNLPSNLETTAEANTSWTTFKNF